MKKLFSLFLLACLALFPVPAQAKPIQVVASFSILGDMANVIGGEDVIVRTIVGPDTDAHNYEPTPDDAKAVAAADVVIMNGLGFDPWMEKLIKASGYHYPVMVASQGAILRRTAQGVIDPHAWQSLANGRIYARNITNALRRADMANAATIYEREKVYDNALDTTDTFVRAQIAEVPAAKRKAVTNHDSFGYYGAAYGVQFMAPEGVSTEAQPSATILAALIRQIRAQGIHILFVENMSNPQIMKMISSETGARIGGTLYADALSGPDGHAPSYIDMFKYNTQLLKYAMLLNQ